MDTHQTASIVIISLRIRRILVTNKQAETPILRVFPRSIPRNLTYLHRAIAWGHDRLTQKMQLGSHLRLKNTSTTRTMRRQTACGALQPNCCQSTRREESLQITTSISRHARLEPKQA